MGYNYYEYLILIAPNSEATMEGLKQKLEAFYANDERTVVVSLNSGRITVNIDGYELYVDYSNAPHVVIESQELAEEFAKGKAEQAVIATCAARFEMAGAPDPETDYFNDSLYVQESMEEFSGVFVFDPMDGSFMNI